MRDDEFDDFDEDDREEGPELGPCCICEAAEGVRNILMLSGKSPTPGRGWGCAVCGLEPDGAVAVLCDRCWMRRQQGTPLAMICTGYPAKDGRTPFVQMRGSHEHDTAYHPGEE